VAVRARLSWWWNAGAVIGTIKLWLFVVGHVRYEKMNTIVVNYMTKIKGTRQIVNCEIIEQRVVHI
jgi:hypothetical protein